MAFPILSPAPIPPPGISPSTRDWPESAVADPAAAHRAAHTRLYLEALDRAGYVPPSVQRSRQRAALEHQRAVAAVEQAIRERRIERSAG